MRTWREWRMGRELGARRQFKVYLPVKMGALSKGTVSTGWVLTREEVDVEETVEARFAAKGYQDPGLRNDHVDIAGRVSRRSSHLLLKLLGALNKRPIWSLKIKNACPQVCGTGREVYLRTPCE